MSILKNYINIVCGSCSCVAVFYSVFYLILFLSRPVIFDNNNQTLKDAVYALLFDVSLLSLFMVQHSLMKRPGYEKFISSLGLQVAERSIYNIATSVVLYILIRHWKPVSYYSLWAPAILSTAPWLWFLIGVHFLAWSIIYGGSLLMDIPEILGIKQVYYDIKGLSPPVAYKSTELKRLYSHMRHPSLTSLVIIFWVVPVMSLDRLLLACLWTFYMILAWRTDSRDVEYQRGQLMRKRYELTRILQQNQ